MKAVNHNSGLGSGFLPRRAQLSSEINVTPFVDVMLVLLIIFMVAAPLMTVGLPVDLPQASLNELEQETEPLNVIIAPGGIVHLGETEITKDNLAATLAGLGEEARQQRVRIRADRTVTYEDIMFVMSTLSENGFTRIGLMALVARGAETMKMISSTSMTSTKGVTFMSALCPLSGRPFGGLLTFPAISPSRRHARPYAVSP